MPQIGVRDLKIHASKIIRQVRDEQMHYIITYRGQPVGVLSPFQMTEVEDRLLNDTSDIDTWAELTKLGKEIGASWQSNQSSAEILSDMRR